MSGDVQTDRLIREVKKGFGIAARRLELIRHNENITCRVFADDGEYALRVHKPADGFSLGDMRMGASDLELAVRETELLAALSNGGMAVQRPVPALAGGYVHMLDGAPATLYTWLQGETLERAERTRELGEQIGCMTAHMHALLKRFDASRPLGGYQYTQRLLPVLKARIASAHKAGAFDDGDALALTSALDAAGARMDALDERLGEPQTVHSDLSPGNLLLTPLGVAPIDFSLNGLSHPLMDIASLLSNINETPTRQGILDGYARESGSAISLSDAEPYFALQILLFICCQYERFISQDWFTSAIKRWIKETFTPLAEGREFLKV